MGARLVVAAGVLLAAPALVVVAAEVDYHGSFGSALAAAEKTHQFVMVVLVAPGQDKQGREVCKLFREETLADEKIAELIRRHFAPVVIDLAERRAKNVPLPPVVQSAFKEGEQLSVPTVLFFTAGCTLVDRIVGYAPASDYYAQIKKVADKAAEAVPATSRRQAERALERGKAAFDRKDFRAAMDALDSALHGGVPSDDLDKARELAEEIQAMAKEKLQEARNLESTEKLGSAIRAYRECARSYKGTDAGKEAAQRLVQLRKDPAIRKRISDYRARKLLAEARAAIQQTRYGDAAQALDTLLEQCADSAEAAEAKELRTRLEADPNIAGQIREERIRADAERLLRIGDGFRGNNMPTKAVAQYRKVIEKYPDTTFAEAARRRIAQIGDDGGKR